MIRWLSYKTKIPRSTTLALALLLLIDWFPRSWLVARGTVLCIVFVLLLVSFSVAFKRYL